MNFYLDATFGYEGQPLLFKGVDFGLDMNSRGKKGFSAQRE